APTGTVTYNFYHNGTATGTPFFTETVAVGSESSPAGPLPAGSYSFKAIYSGDSNYAGSTGAVEPLTVSLPVTIGDFVWQDANGNGIQNSGEAGIKGVTLTLTGTDHNGVPVTDHATTDSTGHYLFTEIAGTYIVTVDSSN